MSATALDFAARAAAEVRVRAFRCPRCIAHPFHECRDRDGDLVLGVHLERVVDALLAPEVADRRVRWWLGRSPDPERRAVAGRARLARAAEHVGLIAAASRGAS